MTDVVGASEGSGVGRQESLVDAWASAVPFDDWVRAVAGAYLASHQRLEGAAKLLGTTPVELQAVLNLATLDDEELAILSESPPPKTTWLSLALSSRGAIEAALVALREMPQGASPYHTVHAAIATVDGPGEHERIAALPGSTIVHMAEKAKQYNLLGEGGQKALADIGKRKRTGSALTAPQVGYLSRLLRQLSDGGAVRRDSPDGDQSDCDAVLDALGV
jgi:hypothetical protein